MDRFPQVIRDAWNPGQLEKALETLLALYRNVRYSLNQRYELELVLSRLAQLRNYVTPGEIHLRIQEIKEELFRIDATEPDDKKKNLNP